jgi:hypothetical protein
VVELIRESAPVVPDVVNTAVREATQNASDFSALQRANDTFLARATNASVEPLSSRGESPPNAVGFGPLYDTAVDHATHRIGRNDARASFGGMSRSRAVRVG